MTRAHAKPPLIVVLAGPNGAGKSTAAPFLLKGALGVAEFVNADVIARGLSGFEPENVAVRAGRIMLERLIALSEREADFAFETTLSSRSLAGHLRHLKAAHGYRVHLIYLWLNSPNLAVRRVAEESAPGDISFRNRSSVDDTSPAF